MNLIYEYLCPTMLSIEFLNFFFSKTRLVLWKIYKLRIMDCQEQHTSPMTPSFIINMMSSIVAIAMLLSMSHVWSVNVTDEPLGPCKPLIKLSFLASSDLLHNLKCEGPVGFFFFKSSRIAFFSWRTDDQWFLKTNQSKKSCKILCF